MKIIIDTNIFFSALLNPKSNIANIIIKAPKGVSFYTPAFMIDEIESHW